MVFAMCLADAHAQQSVVANLNVTSFKANKKFLKL